MKQNTLFQFTGTSNQVTKDDRFKKQRAAYLAQRNAHKRQAKLIIQNKRNFSSSSQDQPSTAKKTVKPTLFQQKSQDKKTTLSPKAVTTKPKVNPESQNAKNLKKQKQGSGRQTIRQKVQAKRQITIISSSSSSQDLPMHKKPQKIILTEPEVQKITKEDNVRVSLDQFESNPFIAFSMTNIQKKKSDPSSHSARLRNDYERKKNVRERYEVEVPSRKAVNVWLQKYLQFKQQTLILGDKIIPIYDINKVKLFFARTVNGSCQMKVTYKEQDIHFAVDHKKLHQLCLDHYYYIFAKIISLKLSLMGKSLNKTHKKPQLTQQQLKGAQITGKVRKSSFFGGWQSSSGVINQMGLCLYKQNKQKPSFIIGYNTVKQIWTRFEQNSENLILKLLHNNKKIELSIPVQNYLSRDSWLYHIYNLASK